MEVKHKLLRNLFPKVCSQVGGGTDPGMAEMAYLVMGLTIRRAVRDRFGFNALV